MNRYRFFLIQLLCHRTALLLLNDCLCFSSPSVAVDSGAKGVIIKFTETDSTVIVNFEANSNNHLEIIVLCTILFSIGSSYKVFLYNCLFKQFTIIQYFLNMLPDVLHQHIVKLSHHSLTYKESVSMSDFSANLIFTYSPPHTLTHAPGTTGSPVSCNILPENHTTAVIFPFYLPYP